MGSQVAALDLLSSQISFEGTPHQSMTTSDTHQ